VRPMNPLSKTSLRVIKGTNVRGQGLLAMLLSGAVIWLVVLILFVVQFKDTEWFWNLLQTLLERIRFW